MTATANHFPTHSHEILPISGSLRVSAHSTRGGSGGGDWASDAVLGAIRLRHR